MAERRPFSLVSEKKYGADKKGEKSLRPLFQTIMMTLERHYDAFGKPLRRL
jgi:hypothetical protein